MPPLGERPATVHAEAVDDVVPGAIEETYLLGADELDDDSPAADIVHTYLKSIGRVPF